MSDFFRNFAHFFVVYMLTNTDIHNLLKQGERLTLECKRCENRLPNSLWDTYSSFANSYGGTILLGIEEHREETEPSRRFTIQGVSNPDKLITDFWNLANDPNKVNVNLLKDGDVQKVSVDGVEVIAIHVPQAEYSVKPVFINGNPFTGSFRRNHEGDYRCTKRQVKAMVRDSYEDGNDGFLLTQCDMDDIDAETLRRYRTLFRYKNEGHVWNEVDDTTFLKNLGGCVIDKDTNKVTLTMAGLMMFGTGLAVRDRFSNFRMDYIDMCNLIGEERYSDRLTYDGRWENNLFQFFSIVLPKMTFDLPRPFRMEGVSRVDDTPQHKAVREAFTNSIIHADLMMESGVLRIEKHEDKLVFRNPGLLRIPVEQVYEGGVSFARNPKIQNMLRMVGYGENLGSGFPMILDAWKQSGWGEPVLKEKLELDEVELDLPLKSVTARVDKGGNEKLTKRQQLILTIIQQEPSISAKAIAEKIADMIAEGSADKMAASTRTIETELAELKRMGIINRVGEKNGGRREIVNPEE